MLHVSVTLKETALSFFMTMVISLFTALLFWRFRWIYKLFEPYLILLNSLPKSALAPLLIVWLGNKPRTIIVVAVSLAVFGAILTLYHAFESVDPEKIKLIQTLNGTKMHIITKGFASQHRASLYQQHEGQHWPLSCRCDNR